LRSASPAELRFCDSLGTGILSIIPYVGSTLGLVISLVVAGLQSGGDWAYIGIIAAIFLYRAIF
jgi:predicted PurR-regulated permease PerM